MNMYFTCYKGRAGVIMVKDFEMNNLSSVVQMGPIQSHKSLKAEEKGRRMCQINVALDELDLPLLYLNREIKGWKWTSAESQ